jgi:malate dehydrogenase (oxaloacetate-decarboxylating)(NADP+)
VLIGREEIVQRNMAQVGVPAGELEIINARLSDRNPDYTEYVYKRLQRDGFLMRDAQRLVNQDRNVFGACMLALGDADGMVTGVTRNFDVALRDVRLVLDRHGDTPVMGLSIIIGKGRTLFIADTSVAELPSAEELVTIAKTAAHGARSLGFVPRVAFLSYSNFGNPPGERALKVRKAVQLMDQRTDIDFEYEGEMNADVALNPAMKRIYPFSRLSEPANVLVMPAIHSAAISCQLMAAVGGATVIGPLMLGLGGSVQIAPLGATVSDIVNLATFAAYDLRTVRA